MSGRRDRSRSPQRGGFNGRDRYKILLKNLPYEVNWQKLKDICKENTSDSVMFADIIMNRNGKSAGFGSAEYKTKEDMEAAVSKLDGFDVAGRKIKVNADINGEQLVRMCNKQGLDPGRSGMASKGADRGGHGGDRYGDRGGRGGYGGPGGRDRGPPNDRYGGPPRGDFGGNRFDEMPMLNGVPINQLPGMERLGPDVLEAIGKGPIGRTIFVRNLAYTVEEKKVREVFGMAGTIQDVDLIKDKDGKSRGFGTITYAQPIEAVKAVVMFHTQSLFDRKMFVKMDRDNSNPRGKKEKLPDGLSGINFAASNIGAMPSGGPSVDRGYGSAPPQSGGYGGNSYAPPSGPQSGGYGGDSYRGGNGNSYNPPPRDSYNGGGGGYGAPQGGSGYRPPSSGCMVAIERLPPSATTARLRRLFEDAGRVSFVDLQDHGRASIRFETAYDAERAVSRFNGYMIEGYSLYARISDM